MMNFAGPWEKYQCSLKRYCLEWHSEKDHPRTHFMELASDTGELQLKDLGTLFKTLGVSMDKGDLRRASGQIRDDVDANYDGSVEYEVYSSSIRWDAFARWVSGSEHRKHTGNPLQNFQGC